MRPLHFGRRRCQNVGAVQVFVLGSGSSGNALLVASEGVHVLVDAGLGPRVFAERLVALGLEGTIRLDAIVATHQHGDHFGHIERVARAFGGTVYLHSGIEGTRVRRKFDTREYAPGKSFRVGHLEILAEHVPHDVPQVAVRVATEDRAVGIATDVGHVTPRLFDLLGSCDAAVVEANYCPELLAHGPYPPSVQRRVSGGLGHLSNGRTAELAQKLVGTRLERLFLGHISRANNTPGRAYETVANAAHRMDVSVLPNGQPCRLDVIRKKPIQLSLPLSDAALDW